MRDIFDPHDLSDLPITEAQFEDEVGKVEVEPGSCDDNLQRAKRTIARLREQLNDAGMLIDAYYHEFGPLSDDN